MHPAIQCKIKKIYVGNSTGIIYHHTLGFPCQELANIAHTCPCGYHGNIAQPIEPKAMVKSNMINKTQFPLLISVGRLISSKHLHILSVIYCETNTRLERAEDTDRCA